jgi:hypothetical protein
VFPPLGRADVDAEVVGHLFPGYEFLAHGSRHDVGFVLNSIE